MPTGKKLNRNTQTWEDVEEVRHADYSDKKLWPQESWALFIAFCRWYPDIYMDILDAGSSAQPNFELEIIQRISVRAFARYNDVYETGARGKTKTFAVMDASMITGALWPGTKRAYFAPSMDQGADLASEAYKSVTERYPLLSQMWRVKNDGKGTFAIVTDYGSLFSINAKRGGNLHSVIAEECAQTEKGETFDHVKFSTAVSGTVRLKRLVNGTVDASFPDRQRLHISNAGTKQNPAYRYRMTAFNNMCDGKGGFCIDFPLQTVVLSGIRDYAYYDDLRSKMTALQFQQECMALWTGSSDNPLIRDSLLTESKKLLVMEERHCGDPDVIYVVASDIAQEARAGNAQCAYVVGKLEKQSVKHKDDKYLKSIVYVDSYPPPKESMLQAKMLKQIWKKYCMEGGQATYLAVDTNNYGKSVLEDLHKDLDDGMPPLCCMNHDYPELELPGAMPILYPIRARGGLTENYDSDTEMIRYAQREWEQDNVQMLTDNIYEGVEAYKRVHRIKDDHANAELQKPYIKTREMCEQIDNIEILPSGSVGIKERRMTKGIQRDMWSSAKYMLRVARVLEYEYLTKKQDDNSKWKAQFSSGVPKPEIKSSFRFTPRACGRTGGNSR